MANWGAFAGGVAEGYESAEKLRIQREAADQAKDEWAHRKKEYDRQDAMHDAISAAGNTVAPDADPSQFLSKDAYQQKFAAPVKATGFQGWVERNFGSTPRPTDTASPAASPAPEDFTGKYNTAVPAANAKDYDAWKSGLPAGMDRSGKDYDLGGAFMAGIAPGENGHLPDTYKKPNHPTFSTDSQYSGKDDGVGGAWAQDDAGKWTFAASKDQMGRNSPDSMHQYFNTNEKDSNLVLPAGSSGAFGAASSSKKLGKDDYAPVTQPDGDVAYVPRSSVKQMSFEDRGMAIAKAIQDFDPVQAQALATSAQQYKSGEYKARAEDYQQKVMAGIRLWDTNPQAALDAISNAHELLPDGQQVKLTYNAKTNKVDTQFFSQTAKGLMPYGPTRSVSFDDVSATALSAGTPEGWLEHQKTVQDQVYKTAMLANARAQTANEKTRLDIAMKAEARAQERDKSYIAYQDARIKEMDGKVGEGWKPLVKQDPDGNMVTGRTNAKTGEVQIDDKEWGKPVKPKFQGTYNQITDFAKGKGLVAKAGADGNIYYINPKTNVASTDFNAALGSTSNSLNRNPANGSAQVPFNP